MFTSAAQILSGILPSSLISFEQSPASELRPQSASPAMQAAQHVRSARSSGRAAQAAGSSRGLQPAGGMHAPAPLWGWREPASLAAQGYVPAEQPPLPMRRSHSFPAHVQAHHPSSPAAGSPRAPPPASPAPPLRTPAHSHSSAGGSRFDDWTAAHHDDSAAQALQRWEHGAGAAVKADPDGRRRYSAVKEEAERAAEGGLAPSYEEHPDRDDVLLISGGSAHLETGTGLLAAVAQTTPSVALPGAQPEPQQVCALSGPEPNPSVSHAHICLSCVAEDVVKAEAHPSLCEFASGHPEMQWSAQHCGVCAGECSCNGM